MTKRSSLFTTNDFTNPLFKFDDILVNSGQCWNKTSYNFIAPVDGIYIFSFSAITTIAQNVKNDVVLVIEGKKIVNLSICKTSKIFSHSSVYTMCCSTVLMLTRDNYVYIRWEFYPNNDRYEQASFKGFLYAPPNNVSVAWSVSTRRHFSKLNFSDQLDVAFTKVIVNVGRVFKENDTNKVIIPINGVYYVTVSACQPRDATIVLLVNGKKQMEIISFDYITQERSFLLHLTTGTSLSLRLITAKLHFIPHELEYSLTGLLVVQS